MDAADFCRHGHTLVDWIATYLSETERYPVLSRVEPGAIRDALPNELPANGTSFDEIFTDFERVLLPGITHWNHPGFFAYFAISGSAAGVLAEFLTAALNVQAMLWRTSPSATELEEVTLGWLRKLLGLPSNFEGVIYDTASIASLHALAAAREAEVPDVGRLGLAGRQDIASLRVYASEHVHSSIDKAVMTLGLGYESLRRVPVDVDYRMRPDALREAIAVDRASGRTPLAVVATVGTTSMTSLDPVAELADVCEHENLWLHVDAAYAGAAALVPETASVMDGCERAGLAGGQPTQMALHTVRPQRLLLPADGCGTRSVLTNPRLPANSGSGKSKELNGYRRAAGTPLSRAETLGGASLLRRPRHSGPAG